LGRQAVRMLAKPENVGSIQGVLIACHSRLGGKRKNVIKRKAA
jgi:hypothetical protein